MLCSGCQSFRQAIYNSGPSGRSDDFQESKGLLTSRPWESLNPVHNSNEVPEITKCEFCYFLANLLGDSVLKIWKNRIADDPYSMHYVEYNFSFSTRSYAWGRLSFELFDRSTREATPLTSLMLMGSKYARLRPNKPIPSSEKFTSSEWSFQKMASWLKICTTEHKVCEQLRTRPSSDKMYTPNRMLYIEVDSMKNLSTVYLREGGEIAPGTKYATLSYCWGERQPPVKLTFKSINNLKSGISVGALPKTFRDAFQVVHKLAIAYIWIDALCIIQDSHFDWENESATMSKVYSYSFINIAATSSSNSNGGLFRYREPLAVNGYPLDSNWHPKFDGDYRLTRESPWLKLVQDSPLLGRAWVFQERMLSPCTLHFAADQLFWDCSELRASEVSPQGIELDSVSKQSMLLKYKFAKMRTHAANQDDSEKMTEMWTDIVEQYTSMKLTRETDKLPAISGVAGQISIGMKGDQYLAGLWQSDLAYSLLWKSANGGHRIKHDTCRTPSWSWASMSGRIVCYRFNEKSEDPKVELRMLNATSVPSPGIATLTNVTSLSICGRLFKSPVIQRLIESQGSSLGQLYEDVNSMASFDEDADKHEWEEGLYCLLVARSIVRDIPFSNRREYFEGLIVIPESSHGQYRRAGTFRLSYDVKKLVPKTRWEKLLESFPTTRMRASAEVTDKMKQYDEITGASSAEKLDPKHYEEFHGGNTYKITLV